MNYKKNKHIFILIILIVNLFNVFFFPLKAFALDKTNNEDLIKLINKNDYVKFKEKLNLREIESIYINNEFDSEIFYYKTTNNKLYKTDNPSYETFKKDLLEAGVKIYDIEKLSSIVTEDMTTQVVSSNSKLDIITVLFIIAPFLFVYAIIFSKVPFKTKKGKYRNKDKILIKSGMSNDNKEDVQLDSNVKKFSDIAGLYEVKKDMQCLVDFLINGEKYKLMGAKLPKGVILYGPPGTGKTLIAKAVAGEAKTNFLYMSGSDFMEMYVGVGAKRVRELFEAARECAPCIIFIDEIDAIGKARGNKNDSSEDRKTLNALLTEMDGFNSSEDILVIAATNRLEDLDSALLRPGRFTDKYCVPLPSTPEERLEIINLYIKDKKLSENVNLNELSKDTIGCSPADIESIINEAAIISVQNNKNYIDKDSLEKAFYKKLLSGHQKENDNKTKEELEVVAWHEAGHALSGILLGADITKVTIISSTSGAGGATFSTPTKMGLHSIKNLENEVIQLYAGRIAEYLLYENWSDVTTGASNDIERATNIIYQMVSIYGMNDSYGLLNLKQLNINNDEILKEVVNISNELKEKTIKLLKDNFEDLRKIAELLIEKETIYREDIDKILKRVM